ncbi:DUF6933 domain-containing protein [Singulisphaera rosea]
MVFRLSHRLSTKIGAGTLPHEPSHVHPYADWSGHLFVAGRTQSILLSNTRSLDSIVFPARGITDEGRFTERALSGLLESMEGDGLAALHLRFIAPECAAVRVGRASDRAVTGSMNGLNKHATSLLAEEKSSPLDVGLRLNEVLLSAIATSRSEKYGKPREAFKDMAGILESWRSPSPEGASRLHRADPEPDHRLSLT